MILDKFALRYRKKMESRLSNKGILFEYITDYEKVAELKNNWLANFAAGIKMDDIHVDQCMWHVFSYKRLLCVDGNEATSNFHSQNKSQCYVFFQHQRDAYYLENAEALTQRYLIDGIDFVSSDLYVVDKKFDWTYVVTHEGECGPYYCQKK